MVSAPELTKAAAENSQRTRTSAEKHLSELHQYTRTNITLLVQWFIFFATANYVTAGWIVTRKSEDSSGLLVYLIIALFVAVCIIAIFFCVHAQRWFANTGQRAEALYTSMQDLEAPFLPHRLYGAVAALMTITLAALVLFWVVLSVSLWPSVPPLPLPHLGSSPPAGQATQTIGQQSTPKSQRANPNQSTSRPTHP